MHSGRDKTKILHKIMKYYDLKTKADVARFFEVKPQTVSTWFKRNTVDYDLVFEKCKDMNLNYLIKEDNRNISEEPADEYQSKESFCDKLEKIIARKDDKIVELSEKIGELRTELKHLRKL